MKKFWFSWSGNDYHIKILDGYELFRIVGKAFSSVGECCIFDRAGDLTFLLK